MGLTPGLTHGATLADRRPFITNKPGPRHPPVEITTRLNPLLECFVTGEPGRRHHVGLCGVSMEIDRVVVAPDVAVRR